MSIFTKWRAVQTCAVNRPGGPETRTTELVRRRLEITTTLKWRPFSLLNPFFQTQFDIPKRQINVHWQHYSGGKGEHLKRLSSGKKNPTDKMAMLKLVAMATVNQITRCPDVPWRIKSYWPELQDTYNSQCVFSPVFGLLLPSAGDIWLRLFLRLQTGLNALTFWHSFSRRWHGPRSNVE